MSKLRDYIEKYVQDLTEILAHTTDDDALLDLAEEKWKLDDPRLLAINVPVSGQLFPKPSLGTGGSDTDGGQNKPVGFSEPSLGTDGGLDDVSSTLTGRK